MSQRVAKMESLIQHTVAEALLQALEREAARVTVTRVDAAPDLRNATVWIGLLEPDAATGDRLWKRTETAMPVLQAALADRLASKFVPRLHVRRDTGGAYAAEIDALLKGL